MLKQPLPPPSPQPAAPSSGSPPPTPPTVATAAATCKANPPLVNPNEHLSTGAASGPRATMVAPPVSGGGAPPGGCGTRGQNTGKGPPQSPGSTCDVKVKSGSTFEGIFKTLSSKFELAVDAVHKKVPDQPIGPRREDIVDTMVFKPADVMLVHFRNVDFNYATKDKFTDSAIAMNSKVNGEHKEKSNGWDPNEMFKFNEENYGVKTTYDSSLSSYTVPLEKDNTEAFRQREARAAQLAREIESSPQYRLRIAMENDDGRTEEEKHSSVQRQVSGRDSPSLASREGKYIPLPQRVRESSRGGIRCSSSRGGRPGMGSLPPRGSSHHSESNIGSALEQRGINGGPSRMSPKSQRPSRGAKNMSSPTSRPMEVSAASPTVGRLYASRSLKTASTVPLSSQDPPVGPAIPIVPASLSESRTTMESSASPTPPSPKVPASIPVAAVEVKEVPSSATKEAGRTADLVKQTNKGLQNEQKRNQLEELRKFGAQFKLQPSSSPEAIHDPFQPKESLEGKVKDKLPEVLVGVGSSCEVSEESPKPSLDFCEDSSKEEKGSSEGMECQTQTSKQINKYAYITGATHPFYTLHPSDYPRAKWHVQHTIYFLHPTDSCEPNCAGEAPQMYPYPVSNSVPGQQGKYRAKGSLPPQRSDQHQPTSAPPIMQAAAAAGPPLVAATPYSSYISYNPQQFTGQPTMMQPMAHYSSQPVFAPVLQSNPRMMTSGSHPQAIVSSPTPQYPPAEQPTPQTLYATVHQSYSHHATQLHPHQPQPATTPTGNQQQTQHAAPSPVQHQAGQSPHLASAQQQQNLYHTATLTATPPSITPGPSAQSPQSGFPQPTVYAIHAHQQLQHGYTNMAHVTQAHVQTGIAAAPPPHPGAPQVMLLHPSQTHGGPPQGGVPQSGVPTLSASTPSPYTYIGHHQVQSHPSQQLPFHTPGN
ncbi:hypothetical protein E2320_022586 [Naja naja]|nr:hypothetical protein E2320_022586 [Naja naja]